MNVDDHLAQQMLDPEFRREWEVHEDCFEEQKRLTRYIIRYRRLRDGYKTQRDEARERARNYRRVLLENYGDMATQGLFAEDERCYEWLLEDDNRPQEVAIDVD